MLKETALLLCFVCCSLFVFSQKKADTTSKLNRELSLEEVVVSASNFSEKKKNIAQKIDIISARSIASANAQNTGDLLSGTGKIFVQKSQQGGSSPVLRGFEASRVLLVIDGVRMNNAIYRSGHLQNAITVDQNMLNRVEVMYGPSSTVYGSDALGGIIQLVTKSPVLSGTKKMLLTGTTFARYSSANDEKTVHADLSMGNNRIAWLQSYTYSDFGDMKIGRQDAPGYPGFGKRKKYIGQVNGLDTILNNPDDRVQKFSGYKQWDITQKILFKQNEHISHLLNFQFSNSTDVPRYDRLQDTFTSGANKGLLRFAQWYYGPQKRILGAYELNAKITGIVDELKLNINYQDIEESRQQREYKRYDRFDSRVEKVKVWGLTLAARKMIGQSEITVGADAQLNDVTSRASRTNLTTGAVSKLDTRYPDGKNRMNNFGVFVQHIHKFKNGKLVLNDGIRVQAISLKSNIEDNSFFHLPDTVMKQEYIAVTGNIGLVYTVSKNTSIRTSLSSGFRAPNVDDLAKVFESNSTARQVVVPNANIKPEYTYNLDISVTQRLFKKLNVELTGFYTIFRNGLVKAPYSLNGQDSILYNGVLCQVLSTQNSNKAYLYGFTAGVHTENIHGFLLNSTVTYSYGRFNTDRSQLSSVYEKQPNGTYLLVKKNVSSKPLDHNPPLIGRTAISYTHRRFTTEFWCMYNGWKRLDEFNADGEDNAQYATADGMPAWFTLNWKGSVNIIPGLQVQLAAENLLDRNYRAFASGFSAAGRNFMVGVRANW